jgi:HEAT repeat protein
VNLFHGRPRGDTLVHWQYGGAYPRHDQGAVLAEFTRTGDLLEEFHNFGHVAVSGMNVYRAGEGLGDYRGSIFTTHFNTHKITRTVVEPAGATFRHVRSEDFLVIDDPDVHLTDVFEDANGTLLVVDTGGWFRNGCPASQIAKPEIAGAIYRIRRAGPVDQKTDFRGVDIDWARLGAKEAAALLGDGRFAVRDRAIAELGRRGDAVLGELRAVLGAGTIEARRNAVWALARNGSGTANELMRLALADKDASVRQAACNGIWRTRDSGAMESLIRLLKNKKEPKAIQMAAARALGRVGGAKAVDALLAFINGDLDRVREHAAVYALIDIGDRLRTAKGLETGSAAVWARTLWALEGIDPAKLDAGVVVGVLDAPGEAAALTAIAVCKRHPEWAETIAAEFLRWREDGGLNDRRRGVFDELLPLFLENRMMQGVLTWFFEAGGAGEAKEHFHPDAVGRGRFARRADVHCADCKAAKS